jgi:DNA topoisomerase-1
VSRPPRSDATAAALRYVSPDIRGIERRRAGRGFRYFDPDGRPISDAAEIRRIRAIAIPPAWTDVWVSPDPNGHILAAGRDARGRRQYRYHPRFRTRRDAGKFRRLARFGAALPRIRRRVRVDLGRAEMPRDKVVATVISLLEATLFRVGNDEYARLNRSFGISTLRNRHATVSSNTIRFRFRGKGGRIEERTLVDRRLATIVRRCQALPGQALFQYVDADGEEHAISSSDVNDYLRDAAGTDEFSAKDFRTWIATVLAYRALREAAPIGEALRRTAEELNDTVTVTRSSYVHPAVLAAFGLDDRRPANGLSRPRGKSDRRGFNRRDELAVLAILRAADARNARPARSARMSAPGQSGVPRPR